jgi:hypothetical protein
LQVHCRRSYSRYYDEGCRFTVAEVILETMMKVAGFYDYIVIFGEKIKLNLKVEKQYEIYKKKHLYLFLLQLNYKNFMKIEKEMN